MGVGNGTRAAVAPLREVETPGASLGSASSEQNCAEHGADAWGSFDSG